MHIFIFVNNLGHYQAFWGTCEKDRRSFIFKELKGTKMFQRAWENINFWCLREQGVEENIKLGS